MRLSHQNVLTEWRLSSSVLRLSQKPERAGFSVHIFSHINKTPGPRGVSVHVLRLSSKTNRLSIHLYMYIGCLRHSSCTTHKVPRRIGCKSYYPVGVLVVSARGVTHFSTRYQHVCRDIWFRHDRNQCFSKLRHICHDGTQVSSRFQHVCGPFQHVCRDETDAFSRLQHAFRN